MSRTRAMFATVVAGLLLVAACSGTDGDDDAASADRTESAEDTLAASADDGAEEADGAGGSSGDVASVDVDLTGAELARKIVYRGEVASEVDDVAAAVGSARAEVAAEGGYVFGQEVTEGRAHVVLKVPSVRFDAAFDAVAGIGEVTTTSIEADDVTEQFTDLESRRATLEASIERLRGFLAASTNVDEISRLESELTRREAERDVIAGQLRVLEDRTSFGTISATFTVADEVATSAPADEADGPPGFARGLEVGWDAVVFAAGVTATASGFLLPFLPLLLLAGGLLWWRRRRSAAPAAA